jgi:hypothetical protein
MADLIDQIGDILQKSGGWGLSAVLLFVIWKLLVYVKELHEERIEDHKITYEILAGVKRYLKSNEKAFDKFSEKLGNAPCGTLDN